MIKNLLNADEDPPPGTKVIIEDKIVDPPPVTPAQAAAEAPENLQNRGAIENHHDPVLIDKPFETAGEALKDEENAATPGAPPLGESAESLPTLIAEIENLDDRELDLLEQKLQNAGRENVDVRAGEPGISQSSETENVSAFAPPSAPKADAFQTVTLFQNAETPPSTAESIRQSGLAYSAAIVLFGSVVFTMILGWFADLLLGSSPWGIAGGIILGGIIGFIQFFRITSQIFKK
ncbi:MAG TPA: hypothetical protein VIL74_25085 [Pyrinomonadaceae bacterium]